MRFRCFSDLHTEHDHFAGDFAHSVTETVLVFPVHVRTEGVLATALAGSTVYTLTLRPFYLGGRLVKIRIIMKRNTIY